jgi:protein phosphatase slingshot
MSFRDEDEDSDDDTIDFFATKRRNVATEIIAGKLYLGDMFVANNAETLSQLNIKRIISLGGFEEQAGYVEHENIDYFWIYIDDADDEPIDYYFDKCNQFIDSSPGPVFVHCAAGISRSPTIVMAYLIKSEGMSFWKAWQYVRSRRPFICPNDGFYKQLEKYAR